MEHSSKKQHHQFDGYSVSLRHPDPAFSTTNFNKQQMTSDMATSTRGPRLLVRMVAFCVSKQRVHG